MYFVTFLLKNLFRRKTRSLLTVLGLTVAVGTVVTLRGVSQGFEESFIENFERRGVDLVVSASGVPDQLRSDLDQGIGRRIEQMAGVRRVNSGLVELVEVQRGDSVMSVLVNGWEPGAPLFNELTMLSGRTLLPDDRHAVLLGASLAENLHKGAGDTIKLQLDTFKVVGVYQSYTVFENGGAVVPLHELQQLMVRPNSVTGFTVVLQPSEDKEALLESVRAQIESLKDERGRPYRIAAQPTRQYVTGSLHIQLAHGMAWLTSGIALVIGAISMLNTMLMSVLERTKEIGILRAVGWSKLRVVRMILGEALLLSLVGAAVGVGLALLLIRILARVPQTSGFISGELAPSVLVEGLLLTLLVTLIGGGYPAARATRLLPTERCAMTDPADRLPLLAAAHLCKTYPDGKVAALVDVSVAIAAGEYVAIMGPSGSGKSTLLNVLGALDRPDAGEVLFEGKPLSRWGSLDRFRALKVGFVFQAFHLLPTLTALENVQVPMFEGTLRGAARARRASELLEAVGMGHRADHLPSRLSIGERQRVAIARSLANDPVLLLADEPTGNLDSQNATGVLDLFAALQRDRALTVVLVTHSTEVAGRAGRVLWMRDGRFVG